MIRLLQGKIHSKEDRALVLLVNGVGYQVFVPNSLLEETDEELTLFIHSHIREDAFSLYGFRSKTDLEFFELLLSINGVGPKMALSILDEPTANIQNAIFTGNLAVLTRISGVGKKIAERIVLELKSKVTPSNLDEQLNSSKNRPEAHEDAIFALESLGYKRHHITRVLSEIDPQVNETEDLIRLFLQRA